MYSIQGIETVFDVMAYTTSALRESGYSDSEIKEYISSALELSCNLDIIELSKEWIEECNSLHADVESTNSYDDTWGDNYYSQFWDDDGERYKSDDYTYDSDEESDEEAYEGFYTCKNYIWDSSVDDDNWEPRSYCELMKRKK